MGRYLYHQNGFLADFNIVIAKDLSDIYERLKLKLAETIAVENAEVLEKINEGMYVVFYNCYFSSYVGKYSPVWINTERLLGEKTKQVQGEKPNCREKEV